MIRNGKLVADVRYSDCEIFRAGSYISGFGCDVGPPSTDLSDRYYEGKLNYQSGP